MKTFAKICFILFLAVYLPSCRKYLDVVPDNTLKIENIFAQKENAWNALAKVYSYLPMDEFTHDGTWSLGDEYIGRLDEQKTDQQRAIRIMRGLQSSSDPLLGHWSGTEGGKKLYEAIRQANVFLENIDAVYDMTEIEKADWSAQVKFLKAYYSFLLLQKYGPIVIADKIIAPDALEDELFQSRSKIDDCFDFIIRLMDEAIPRLKERANMIDWGQVDRMVATAIKARVMLFRASPFFNGNKDYYGDFFDKDGQLFFPQTYDKEKWKDAIVAIDEAIDICLKNGKGLYTYDKEPYLYDREDFALNEDQMKVLYDMRMVICDPWNKELIWGKSNIDRSENYITTSTNMRLPNGYGEGVINNTGYSWQWMGATYRMAERYYTKNGLPIDEDKTFDINAKHEIVLTPGAEDPAYDEMRGLMQPGAQTIRLYLDREPRFYANLGFTGSYWRAHSVRINTMMFAGTDGGYDPARSSDHYPAGIGIQKFVHPESTSGAWERVIKYPFPIIRMADLYLMKAEALNEYYDAPTQEVYDAINTVRERAGIPKVETVWADESLVNNVNKHLTQGGMRDIILQERGIELAFEGNRYWDMIRHKRAVSEFSRPVWGWQVLGKSAQTFFNLEVKQIRIFTVRDCLWPIDLDEMNTNSRLIQNPGWK